MNVKNIIYSHVENLIGKEIILFFKIKILYDEFFFVNNLKFIH